MFSNSVVWGSLTLFSWTSDTICPAVESLAGSRRMQYSLNHEISGHYRAISNLCTIIIYLCRIMETLINLVITIKNHGLFHHHY